MKERTVEMVLTLGLKPKGQGRPRFDPRSGHAFTPPGTRAYVEALRAEFKAYWTTRDPLSGPVAVLIEAAFELPKSSRKSRDFHLQKPDLDNITKAVLDALTPVKKGKGAARVVVWPGVLSDDAIVTDLHARKDWSITGNSLSVTVWSIA